MNGIGIVLGATDIGFDSLTDAEVRQAISRLSIREFAPFVGRISSALHVQLESSEFQRAVAQTLLGPAVLHELSKRWLWELDNGKSPLWVIPAQLRLVLKLLFEEGAVEGGERLDSEEGLRILGAVILSIQATYRESVHLGPRPPDPKGWLHDTLRFKHSTTLLAQRHYQTLSHKELTYERIFQNADLLARFQEAYGTTPQDIHGGLVALWLAFSTHDADRFRHSSEHAVDHRMLFGRFGVSRSAGALILKILACDLRSRPTVSQPPPGMSWSSDLRFLVERPLGMLDDNLICCLDFDFLRSSYARLLFNLATKMLSKEEANRLVRQVGGQVLEESAEDWFRAFGKERSRSKVGMGLKLPGNLEVDGLVTEDHEVVLFELKSGVLPLSVVLGYSVDDLASAIDKKYIKVDDKNKPYGFTQLARAARLILDNPSLVGLNRVKRIYPVVVVEDDDLPFKPAALYVLNEASKVLRPLGRRVTNPILLHMEDLAMMAERCRRYSVPYMMKRMWREGFSGFSFRDLVTQRLTIRENERVHLQRPFPWTDPILDEAFAKGPNWAEIVCPTCGSYEKTFTSDVGVLVSRCGKCSDGPEREVLPDLQAEVRSAEARWITEYES